MTRVNGEKEKKRLFYKFRVVFQDYKATVLMLIVAVGAELRSNGKKRGSVGVSARFCCGSDRCCCWEAYFRAFFAILQSSFTTLLPKSDVTLLLDER